MTNNMLLQVISASILCILAATAFAAPGDWPERYQNSHLTAIQPLAGNMVSTPTVIARYALEQTKSAMTPLKCADGSYVGLTIVGGALYCFSPDGRQKWICHPPGLNMFSIKAAEDLDGDGNADILCQAGRSAYPFGAVVLISPEDGQVLWRYDVEPMSYAFYVLVDHYLPDLSSKQIVVLMHAYPPDPKNGYIALFEFPSKGSLPVQKWRYDFDAFTCFPTVLMSDLEGDGVKELVVETHSRMWYLDAKTGVKKAFFGWDPKPANVRSYGLVRFVDLNKDGLDDFLCIGNFSQHHEVLLNKKGTMELAWTHGWPESVTVGTVATIYPDPPYANIDRDDGYKIVISMYNSEGEGKWLVRAYDALSGELKYRFPGVVVTRLEDLDHDGHAEIIGNKCSESTGKKFDGACVLGLRKGKLDILWSDDQTTACADGHFERGTEKFTLSETGNGKWTVKAFVPPTPAVTADFSVVSAIQGPISTPDLLAAELSTTGQNDLILKHKDRIEILRLADNELKKINEYASSTAPVVADLNGDGKNEIVLTKVQSTEPPIVEALTPSLEDKTLWRSQLPPSSRSGIPHTRSYLRTGKFTGRDTPDLYFFADKPLPRSVGLDGRDGHLLWEKDRIPGLERFWGPSINDASVYDYDHDGKEDLVFTNPDYYNIASGPTGDLLIGPLFPPKIFNQASQGLYTRPAVLDQEGTGPLVALVTGHIFLGVMTINARPLWYDLPPMGEVRCSSEAFMQTADGWLMGYGQQNGNFICKNVKDNATRWKFPLEASASDPAVCDIDGDGKQEFVFGTSHGFIYALGDAGDKPRLVWKLKLDAAVGPLIIADLNNDGRSEAIVTTANGYINVIDLAK